MWFLYTQLSTRPFDWALAIASAGKLHRWWLVLCLLPIFGTYYGRALRWAVFLRPLKARPSIRNLISATVIGFTAITLFGRAGDFVRPCLIAAKEKVSVSSQVSSWFLERIFDLLTASCLFGFALTKIDASGIHLGVQLTWVLAFGGRIVGFACAGGVVLLFSLRHIAEPVQRWLTRVFGFLPEPQFRKMEKLIAAFVQGVESTRSDGALALIFAYSILEWTLIFGCYWCLARAFAGVVNLTFVEIVILMAFVSFGGIIQVPGVGGGTQVVAALVLTELFGVRLELAASFAMMLWIFTFVAIVPVGVVMALKEGWDWHSLRRIGQEAGT